MAKQKKRTQALARRKVALARRKVALVRRAAQQADIPSGPMGIIIGMARDKRLSVEKLGALIGFQKDIMQVNAKAAFDRDFDAMVLEIPVITKRGAIKNRDGIIQSRYSKFEDIQKVVKPITKRFGFHQSFSTTWPAIGVVEVIGLLHHREGHARESRFQSKADPSGSKNDIQGLGSANAYGRRYTTIDLLNIVCEGVDDDGQATSRAPRGEKPAPPEGRDANGDLPITNFVNTDGGKKKVGQLQRLMVIVKKAGRAPEEMKAWLKARYGYESSKQIKRKEYEEICKAVESPGPLPMPPSGGTMYASPPAADDIPWGRTPGEEG